ncbi:MAG: ABC transporter substrate-binding protein [Nitrospirae bacterium]|nr:ABC transporter substrate-binding protein [Nitrospirota bacterium]
MKAGDRLPNHLYLRLGSDPGSLDPALITDVQSGSIAAKLFNGLLKLDADMRIVPDIASNWNVSDDGKIYTFHLRGGARFPDGRAVTADDVLYSFRRVLDPSVKSPNGWVFGKVASMEAVDAATFRITLSEPFSPFPGLMTMTAAYIVDRKAVERLGPEFGGSPVGTGPYRVKSWRRDRELVLEARSDYWGGAPALSGIVYKIIPEHLTAIAEFETGNLDVIGIPASEYKRFRESEFWNPLILELPGLNTYYLGMNCDRPPMNDRRIRQAVAHAIDRKKILATFYEGRGIAADGPIPPVLRKWPAPPTVEYDPVLARKMLGLPHPPPEGEGKSEEGLRITLYVNAEQETVDMAEIIQSYLRDVGISLEIRRLEWSAFKDAINKGEPDMFWLSWWADYPDAENFLFPLFHSSNLGPAGNRTRYRNVEVDKLIEQGRRTANNADIYSAAENAIAADSPWIFFWHRTDYAVRQPWVRGFRLYPIYTIDKGMDTRVERSDGYMGK